MLKEQLNRFLTRHQRILAYMSVLIAMIVLLILIYDEFCVEHHNPYLLFVLVVILSFGTLGSYMNRRQYVLSRLMIESSDIVSVYALDLNYRYMATNQTGDYLMKEVFGFVPKAGESPMRYLEDEKAAQLKSNVDRAAKGETLTFVDTVKYGDETFYWQNMVSPIYNHKRKIIGTLGLVVDVTEQRKNELEMQKLAYEDSLTQVHNRRYIELAFEKCLADKVETISVIVFDLNKFKEANDTYGHVVGDEILVTFGAILTEVMPSNAVVARLGGDEFAVLLPDVSESQVTFLMKLVRIEMQIKRMLVTASMGAYTDSYTSQKQFVDFCENADKAMYADKNQEDLVSD
nr:GGDEF domain-containing protein [Streptococcus lutetiensis]